jgi:hypothetical protein
MADENDEPKPEKAKEPKSPEKVERHRQMQERMRDRTAKRMKNLTRFAGRGRRGGSSAAP